MWVYKERIGLGGENRAGSAAALVPLCWLSAPALMDNPGMLIEEE